MRRVDPSLTSYQQELAGALDRLLDILALVYDGFLKHRAPLLDQARERARELQAFETRYSEKLVCEGGKEGAKLLVGLSGHVQRVLGCFEGLARIVEQKITEGTLFSEKAVTELKYVFTATRDLLRDVRDAALTGNPILVSHIAAAAEKLSQTASEFSTQHEERLVAGVCQPSHSAMYLGMVDNLRLASWHLKEMAAKLLSEEG